MSKKKTILILSISVVVSFFLYLRYKKAQQILEKDPLIINALNGSSPHFDSQKYTQVCEKKYIHQMKEDPKVTASQFQKENFIKTFCECTANSIEELIHSSPVGSDANNSAQIKNSENYLKMEQACIQNAAKKIAPIKFKNETFN